ncbi:PREDICTED: uncharacterized protein LOC107330569 [Acropora digitifera]|uniref:uncharacterized protein LOC107330569 n=1 Tax=Acropora digitifera TaxID=70779 RepID=UPI00077ADE24|nr:PREDICTED: uncharacterized protein LOC107330569 [Acropora digitifera]
MYCRTVWVEFFRSFHSVQYPMNNNVSLNVSFSDSPDSSPSFYEGTTGGVRYKIPRSGQSKDSQEKSTLSCTDGPAPGLSNAKDGDKLNVTMVTNKKGWKITVTGQLLTELAKHPLVRLSGLLADEIPELKAWAKDLDINFVLSEKDKKMVGYPDEDHLAYPPDDLDIDVLIIHSYGIDLGRQKQP